jgi:hypothetical protein
MPSTMKFIRHLFSAAAVVVLVGCGAATTTATTSVSVSPSPASAHPGASPVASPTPDLGAASAAALKLFVAPTSPGANWGPCSNSGWAACPLTTQVEARLDALRSQRYFSDGGGCGEDYITATQNGFNNAPQVLSAVAGANASVTVVIQRRLGQPNLTATMTETNATCLASDLASGIGPSASIFSAKPNC